MEKVEKLSMDDVIASDKNNGIVSSETFKAQEAIMELARKADIHWSLWTQNGMQCQIIGQNTGGWRKGKIRLCFEFIPNEPEPPTTPESPLDDLRKEVNQVKRKVRRSQLP